MSTICIRGRVFPGHHKMSSRNPHLVTWSSPGVEVNLDIRVKDGAIEILCTPNKFDRDKHAKDLLYFATQATQASADLYGFRTGVALIIIFDTIEFDGVEHDINYAEESFAALATAIKDPKKSDQILHIMAKEREVLLAVRDLIDSIRFHDTALINFARAIESIRNTFIPNGGSREDGWPIMRKSLNLTKGYLKFITEASRGPRHGERLFPSRSGIPIKEVGARAWTVANRYFEFRLRGGTEPLPASEFPELA